MNFGFKILAILVFWGMVTGCDSARDRNLDKNVQNPVLPGDHPNPSVIRIGDYYYATTTSNEWSPLFPIYKSTDLQNWELISYVFPGGAPDWAHNNFWAPELSYDEKQQKVYVYYTSRAKATNRITIAVASADTPEGPFYDQGPLKFDIEETIDPFEVRDENGNLFLIWKEVYFPGKPAIIWAQRISEDRSSLIGPKHELIRNDQEWEKHIVEGPSIFKRGDYFYLLYSAGNCCDQSCDYKIGVARSKALLGPWEKYERNPILADNAIWKCPGTGMVIEQRRDYYLLFHAYSANGGDYIGREGVLAKVFWDENNWPYFHNLQDSGCHKQLIDFKDDFSGALSLGWEWRATQHLSYATGENGLMLAASVENDQLGSLLVQPVKSVDFQVTATIDLGSTGRGVNGGVALIGAANNGFGAPVGGIGISAGHELIEVWCSNDSGTNIYEALPTESIGDVVKLRMQVEEGHWIRFSVFDGDAWELVADSVDASGFVPWGMGFRWGLVAKGGADEFVNIRDVELINICGGF